MRPIVFSYVSSRWIVLLIVLSLCCALVPVPVGADATSSHFMIKDSLTDISGGNASSTDFSSVFSIVPVSTGEASSSSFTVLAGPMYFDSFAPFSQNWQWFDDENNETPSLQLASENVAPSNVSSANTVKLRITVAETAGIGQNGTKFRLQYSTSSDFSSGAYEFTEAASCDGTSVWCYANGAGVDNDVISTTVLSDPDACVASVGNGCGTHNESGVSTSSFTHVASAKTEYEFTVRGSRIAPNTVYFFRLYDNAGDAAVPLNTGQSYPSLSTSGTTLTFSIDGLATSTATEGVTTDINTTSTNVPFGQLSFNATNTAAQRLTITTNANQGYAIFAYQGQGFVGQSGDEIPPVDGTNSSPTDWISGCHATSSGCYGYHTGEDVLAGGSTRFAADDTYAQFSSTPAEIAYSSGPVTDKVTDMVYRVKVTDQQAADSYTTNIVYIAVPTF